MGSSYVSRVQSDGLSDAIYITAFVQSYSANDQQSVLVSSLVYAALTPTLLTSSTVMYWSSTEVYTLYIGLKHLNRRNGCYRPPLNATVQRNGNSLEYSEHGILPRRQKAYIDVTDTCGDLRAIVAVGGCFDRHVATTRKDPIRLTVPNRAPSTGGQSFGVGGRHHRSLNAATTADERLTASWIVTSCTAGRRPLTRASPCQLHYSEVNGSVEPAGSEASRRIVANVRGDAPSPRPARDPHPTIIDQSLSACCRR